MAKKRASLKDKGAETLGLTGKKGKGIDVLFGGPLPTQPTDQAASPATDSAAAPQTPEVARPPEPQVAETPVDTSNDLSGLSAETPVATPTTTVAPAESLPVNEADDEADVTSSEAVVDELGLPVAMEAPPPDLELATPMAEPTFEPAVETAPPIPPPESLPVAQPAPPTSPPESLPMNEADEADDDDLSGLVAEDDLSGLVAEAEAAPAPTTIPPANLPPSPPPVTAAPAEVSPAPPASAPASPRPSPYTPPPSSPPSPAPYRPPTSTSSTTYTARPSTMGTPPSTATGAPSLSMPRSKIQSVSGIATKDIEVKEEDILPEDTKFAEGSFILEVEKRAEVEEDKEKAQKVTRYIGRDRRENLDKEIERLYDEVATQLDKPEEITAAFKILHEAQDIIFEDARQYDEALYRVATVKAMLAHKQHLARWSYTWGLFVFFYALVWLIAFFAGLLFRDQLSEILGPTSEMVNVIRSGWLPAVAGGIGGVTGILYSLYWRVSKARNFDPQDIMYYLTQPILGFILGAIFYFIIAAGFLTFNRGELLDTFGVTALYVFFGWSAGFRQRAVLETVEKILRYVLRKSDETKEEEKSGSASLNEAAEGIQSPPGETQ
jgi:hypothetical protein